MILTDITGFTLGCLLILQGSPLGAYWYYRVHPWVLTDITGFTLGAYWYYRVHPWVLTDITGFTLGAYWYYWVHPWVLTDITGFTLGSLLILLIFHLWVLTDITGLTLGCLLILQGSPLGAYWYYRFHPWVLTDILYISGFGDGWNVTLLETKEEHDFVREGLRDYAYRESELEVLPSLNLTVISRDPFITTMDIVLKDHVRIWVTFYYRLQPSCEGYVSTPVCDSVHKGGVSASGFGGGVYQTPWADTTRTDIPPGRYPPGRHPLHAVHAGIPSTIGCIRILLECILVVMFIHVVTWNMYQSGHFKGLLKMLHF